MTESFKYLVDPVGKQNVLMATSMPPVEAAVAAAQGEAPAGVVDNTPFSASIRFPDQLPMNRPANWLSKTAGQKRAIINRRLSNWKKKRRTHYWSYAKAKFIKRGHRKTYHRATPRYRKMGGRLYYRRRIAGTNRYTWVRKPRQHRRG